MTMHLKGCEVPAQLRVYGHARQCQCGTASRKWRVQGIGHSGGPVTLTIVSSNHDGAVREAGRRRVRVESCMLVDDVRRVTTRTEPQS